MNPPSPADTDFFIQEAEWMKEVVDWPMPKIEGDGIRSLTKD